MGKDEQSYIMIKPDGVQRGIYPEVLRRFEQRGYKLVGLKLMSPGQELLKEHYKDLSHLPFFPKLIEYMTCGPVIAMVW